MARGLCRIGPAASRCRRPAEPGPIRPDHAGDGAHGIAKPAGEVGFAVLAALRIPFDEEPKKSPACPDANSARRTNGGLDFAIALVPWGARSDLMSV